MRSFYNLLLNTALANLTVNFFWFAYTFWLYLETRSVLVTAILSGSYFALMAITGVPFGILIDRIRKKTAMLIGAGTTLVCFSLALVFYLATGGRGLAEIGGPNFWIFFTLMLAGSIVENIRIIALQTCVTLMVPDEGVKRAKANGLVGMVNGVSFMLTTALSGVAVGFLGFFGCLLISVGLTGVTLAQLLTVRIEEKEVSPATQAPQKAHFREAFALVIAVPGLLALILFSTFNNLMAGVFSALVDPYGLELMSVQNWGIAYSLASLGFLIGTGAISRWGLGASPLRLLMIASGVMWLVSIFFTIRESAVLLILGLLIFMSLSPVMEAAEQTILQRVVPYEKQGRIFGFAQAVEIAATPITTLGIGPVAHYFFIPYMDSFAGKQAWGWMLGEGSTRGIALVFVLFSVVGLAATILAVFTRQYRQLSLTYRESEPEPLELSNA